MFQYTRKIACVRDCKGERSENTPQVWSEAKAGALDKSHPPFADVPNRQSRWTVGFNGTPIKGEKPDPNVVRGTPLLLQAQGLQKSYPYLLFPIPFIFDIMFVLKSAGVFL